MKRKSLTSRWLAFHKRHPEVYREILRRSRDVKKTGRDRYGIATIYEVMRYHFDIEMDVEEPYKLSNDFRAFYARKIMYDHPDEFHRFFALKTSEADRYFRRKRALAVLKRRLKDE